MRTFTIRISQVCHGHFLASAGRRAAPQLKQLLPAWLQAQHDDHAPAAARARATLTVSLLAVHVHRYIAAFPHSECIQRLTSHSQTTFPEAKLPEVLAFCKVEVVTHLLDNLLGNAETVINKKLVGNDRERTESRVGWEIKGNGAQDGGPRGARAAVRPRRDEQPAGAGAVRGAAARRAARLAGRGDGAAARQQRVLEARLAPERAAEVTSTRPRVAIAAGGRRDGQLGRECPQGGVVRAGGRAGRAAGRGVRGVGPARAAPAAAAREFAAGRAAAVGRAAGHHAHAPGEPPPPRPPRHIFIHSSLISLRAHFQKWSEWLDKKDLLVKRVLDILENGNALTIPSSFGTRRRPRSY